MSAGPGYGICSIVIETSCLLWVSELDHLYMYNAPSQKDPRVLLLLYAKIQLYPRVHPATSISSRLTSQVFSFS
jgi:hypothetical protein